MEICKIKLKSKTNPNVFLCETEQGIFELFGDVIVKNNIKVGEFEDEKFFGSVAESSEIIAFNLAVKYIGSRFKTEKQIFDYLTKKGYEKSITNNVVEKLKNYSFIDDKIYVENYIKSNKNFSKNKLKQKLFSCGVKSDVFDNVSVEIDDEKSCEINAQKFLKNKPLNKQTKEKLIRRLMGMGYTWEIVSKIIKNYVLDGEEFIE